jgi:hypothetical protein
MKYLLLILALYISGCGYFGPDYRDYRPKPEVPEVPYDEYIVIGKAIINISSEDSLSLAENITYVVANANVFTIDASGISTPVENGDILNVGNIDVSNMKVNNLNQCGGGSDKCTSAIVRVYTTDVTGSEGIAGFVNTDDGYGIDVTASESGGLSGTAGLDVAGAVTVDSYTIPASDRKLTSADFGGVSYDIDVDFSNAGVGSYEMNLVIEIAVN